MQVITGFVTQPLQPLTLRAHHHRAGLEGLDQLHVRTQPRQHTHVPMLAQVALRGLVDVAHVAHH
jgi:hypothetical protein